ncbi:hypothetical protein [Allostreptomyces psammosilenae]|uniref:Uncharacterized protein n=1 Tax=Allostreptomyces psammosilenae TaxID=1892865 RepID=A0A852ZP05_9ACTN|nr:hypothetical protein [Allostreptomyces psammosilenae]NYI03435.1 hypothetical protein [Allostreptomyces psammosilenae]
MPTHSSDPHTVRIEPAPLQNTIVAQGGDAAAASLLQRAGFIPDGDAHRLPDTVTADADQRWHAHHAYVDLTGSGYHVHLAPELHPTGPEMAALPLLVRPVSHAVSAVADRLATATHTRQVDRLLSEFTAPTGVLSASADVLRTIATWWNRLGEADDAHNSALLEQLADEIDTLAAKTDVLRTRLAGRYAPHPGYNARVTTASATEARAHAAGTTSPAHRQAAAGASAPPPSPPAASGRPQPPAPRAR